MVGGWWRGAVGGALPFGRRDLNEYRRLGVTSVYVYIYKEILDFSCKERMSVCMKEM